MTTDGAPSMTGRTNGITKKFWDTIGSEGVVENVCTKEPGFTDIMKYIVQCMNYNRDRGLNHRKFNTFLEELHRITLMLYTSCSELAQ